MRTTLSFARSRRIRPGRPWKRVQVGCGQSFYIWGAHQKKGLQRNAAMCALGKLACLCDTMLQSSFLEPENTQNYDFFNFYFITWFLTFFKQNAEKFMIFFDFVGNFVLKSLKKYGKIMKHHEKSIQKTWKTMEKLKFQKTFLVLIYKQKFRN